MDAARLAPAGVERVQVNGGRSERTEVVSAFRLGGWCRAERGSLCGAAVSREELPTSCQGAAYAAGAAHPTG